MNLRSFASFFFLGTASALCILAGNPTLSFEPDRNGYSGEDHYVNVCVEKKHETPCFKEVPYNDPALISLMEKYKPSVNKRIPWLSDALDNGTLAIITYGGWGLFVVIVLIYSIQKRKRKA